MYLLYVRAFSNIADVSIVITYVGSLPGKAHFTANTDLYLMLLDMLAAFLCSCRTIVKHVYIDAQTILFAN